MYPSRSRWKADVFVNILAFCEFLIPAVIFEEASRRHMTAKSVIVNRYHCTQTKRMILAVSIAAGLRPGYIYMVPLFPLFISVLGGWNYQIRLAKSNIHD